MKYNTRVEKLYFTLIKESLGERFKTQLSLKLNLKIEFWLPSNGIHLVDAWTLDDMSLQSRNCRSHELVVNWKRNRTMNQNLPSEGTISAFPIWHKVELGLLRDLSFEAANGFWIGRGATFEFFFGTLFSFSVLSESSSLTVMDVLANLSITEVMSEDASKVKNAKHLPKSTLQKECQSTKY